MLGGVSMSRGACNGVSRAEITAESVHTCLLVVALQSHAGEAAALLALLAMLRLWEGASRLTCAADWAPDRKASTRTRGFPLNRSKGDREHGATLKEAAMLKLQNPKPHHLTWKFWQRVSVRVRLVTALAFRVGLGYHTRAPSHRFSMICVRLEETPFHSKPGL